MLPTPSGTPRYTSTQRRLLTVSAGLGVAALAGVAFVVTYGDLRALVVEGHAPRRLAPAYPVMFDALITVTILALVVARNSRWWTRWPRWLLLLVLLAGAAAASVQRATKGYAALPDEALKAGTAVAPHVMLLLAIWLWMAMFKQARTALARRAASSSEGSAPDEDGPPTTEIPADRPEVPGSGTDREPEHQPAGELTDDQPHDAPEDTTWPNPWVPEEAALDWALVPYDPEPAPPYEPDPAIQPYEPDPVRPYQPEPVPDLGPDPFPDPVPEPVRELGPDPFPGTAGHQEPAVPAAPATLPTDIKLVGRPAAGSAADEDEDGADLPVTDRAEDPDAGEDHPVTGHAGDGTGDSADRVERWSAEDVPERTGGPGTDRPELEPDQTTEVEWRPPSSTFRSSPTPPDD
jgi:hypothetical protein